MSDETPPRPPRVEYPTRASLRGRAPSPATAPIDRSKVSEAERQAGTGRGAQPGPGRPVIGRPATGRAAGRAASRAAARAEAGRAETARAETGRAGAPAAASGRTPVAAAGTAPAPAGETSLFEPAPAADGNARTSTTMPGTTMPATTGTTRTGTTTGPAATAAGAPAATRSTSRRTAPPLAPGEPLPHPSRKLPIAVVALVALVGAILVGAGVLQGTVFKPATTITASLPKPATQPVVVAEAGMMALDGPRFQVTANSSSNTPVFLGIGRASDVQAYLAKVSRLSLVGEDGAGVLTSRATGSEASLPDPGSADVWVVSVRGRGTASLNWPDVGGQWVLVAATDGTQPAPAKVTFTWSGTKPASSGSALIAIGAVLLISGLVLVLMLISRARMERET